MRSGTRKVADSKPDAPIRKDSDIPMSEIGKKENCALKVEVFGSFMLSDPFLSA